MIDSTQPVGLPPAEIAGIAVGAISIICLLALGVLVLWQRTHIRVRGIVQPGQDGRIGWEGLTGL